MITKDTEGSNYLSVEYLDDGKVLISQPSSEQHYVYVVKQEFLSKLLLEMETKSDHKAV